MKRIILLIVLLASSVACGTIANIGTSVPTKTSPATISPTQQSFSGSSNQATALFPLRAGLARFDMTHNGKYAFLAHLLDAQGNEVSWLGYLGGPGQISKAVKIESPGQYLLNVTAAAEWTITVSQ